jgi:uncharacterized protein YaiI (UPF0178 family)
MMDTKDPADIDGTGLWIDADGCPKRVVQIAQEMAVAKGMICWTVSNFHHELQGKHHLVVDDRSQSVDMAILNRVKAGDLVVTQDIGLAAMVLGKGCRVLGIYGQEYKQDNIELLLEMREQSARWRRAGKRTKGPKKRTPADDERFANLLREILQI